MKGHNSFYENYIYDYLQIIDVTYQYLERCIGLFELL